jgi:hypothetical protein
VVKEPKELKEL